MTIIKMKSNFRIISIITLLLLTIATNASDPSGAAPTDFQLIDLTALLGSLNLTYEDLGINPANLTSMAASSTSYSSNSAPASSNANPPATDTPSNAQSPSSYSPPASAASNPSLSGQETANSASKGATKDNQNSDNNKAPTTDNGKNSLQTTVPNKQLTVNPQNTKNNDISSVKKTDPSSSLTANSPSSSSSINYAPTSKNIPTASPSSSSTPITSQTSNGNINNPPIIGPGPTDPNLPPVLDFSKMVINTNLLTPSSSSSSPSGSSSSSTPSYSSPPASVTATTTTTTSSSSLSSSPSSSSPQSSPLASTSTLPPSQPSVSKDGSTSTTAPITTSKNTNINSDSSSKSTDASTQTSNPSINSPPTTKTDQFKPTQIPQQKSSIQNVNNPTPVVKPVTQAPIPASVSQPVQSYNSVPSIVTTTATADVSSSPAAGQYQYFSTNEDAIYSLTPSYKSFLNYFIISVNDPILPKLQEYLFSNYGNYLNNGELIVGLRLYNGDGSLDYQLLYNTNYGTFTSIMTVQPENVKIQLKTLSILNFFIMEIDYPNCQQQNAEQKNCKICKESFRNFMGRCKPYDPFCIKYAAEQCISCSKGKALSSGYCQ